jgi:hypothetical protein
LPDHESTGTPRGTEAGSPYPLVSAGRRSSGYGYRTAGRRGATVPPELLEPRKRRLTEYAMPAAVILAGVLVVVAFALIISRAGRNDDNTNPALPPPILATGLPPTDQAVIPLPSPSPSDVPSPSPTVTVTTKPPARKAPPPDLGSIKLVKAAVPGSVNLTAEGSRDWVHWGEQSTFSLERDKNGNFAILEGSPTAPRFRHALSPQRFSWTGGDPVDHSDGTPTGIRTCGAGNGFTLSAPATNDTRTLRLYIGVLAARGKLTAKLSTGGSAATATIEDKGNTLSTAVFVVTYRAPKDGKLNLTWVTDAAFSSDCGGVALEAATLR